MSNERTVDRPREAPPDESRGGSQAAVSPNGTRTEDTNTEASVDADTREQYDDIESEFESGDDTARDVSRTFQ